MDDTSMLIDELEGLKNTVSGTYRDRLGKMREPAEERGEMRLCPYCGAPTPAVIGKCTKCGADLSGTTEEDLQAQEARRKVFDEGIVRR
jgi:predicted amidophosphoribosyltransferase